MAGIYDDIDDAGLEEMEAAILADNIITEEVNDDTVDKEEDSDSVSGDNDVDDTEPEEGTDTDTDTDNEDDLDPAEGADEFDTDTDDSEVNSEEGPDHAERHDKDEEPADGKDSTQEGNEEEGEVADESTEKPDFDIDEYNRLKEFHRKVTDTEIVVNGVKTKPFTDPEKILKAQQASGGLSKKFEAIKGTRTVVDPLKKRGLLQDTERFDLLMKVNDGDPEAIKELLKQTKVDPMELDMDEIKYERTPEASTEVDLMFKDALEIGEQYGVKDKIADVVLSQWDDGAKQEFFSDSSKANAISAALAEQMSNGIYDRVMAVAEQLKSIDVEGRYTNLNSIDMYNEASKTVNVQIAEEKAAEESAKKADTIDKSKVEAEKAKLKQKREKEEYEAKAKAKEDKVNKARREATNNSKAKHKTTVTKKYDPLALEGDELDEFERGLMELYG